MTPAPRTSAPGTDHPLGWGVLAPGRIAHPFVADLAHVEDARLVAVGSRSQERASTFAEQYADPVTGPATAYDSYAALLADPAVDVVYVASPHGLHLDHVRQVLEAGKHVLVEKPVTLTAADAEEMVALAAHHDRFLMEAMWTACHPVVRALLDALATGELGTPRHLRAELGFRVDAGPGDRLLDPALGAGSLLDMGIYPLTLAHLVLGPPEHLVAQADLAETGIDLDVAITGRYRNGALATMTASMTSWSDQSAAIATDLGRIEMLGSFHHPDAVVFTRCGDEADHDTTSVAATRRIEGATPVLGRGYAHEAVEVARCVRAGLRESPLVPHAQTVALMHQLDDVRRQIGVRYPGEA